jgi:hypothetical protein
MRILCVVTGHYGRRIASHLRDTAPADWQVSGWEGPINLPVVIDEPEMFLPDELPETDLLLSLAESASLSDLVPELASRCQARAVIAPIDRWTWLPPGLARQLAERLKRRGVGFAAPSPFCALRPHISAHPLVNTFAERYGAPDIRLAVEQDRIASWELHREAPCGNTRFVVKKLMGVDVRQAEEMAGLLHHYYPCLAVMPEERPGQTHTLLHAAAKMVQAAVSQAVVAGRQEEVVKSG